MSECRFPLSLTTIAAILLPPLIFLVIKKWKKSNYTSSSSVKLPPGPKELPIIGHLHHLSGLPFRCFRDLAEKHGPIMYLKLGENPNIIVSSPEIAREMLKEQDPNYADRPESIALKIMWYNCLDIAFCRYNNYWKHMRKICFVELLSAKSVRSFGSIRNDEVSELINDIGLSCGDDHQPINLTDKIISKMSSITCKAAFGKACKDSDAFIKLMKEALDMAGGFMIADLFPSSKIVNALSWIAKLRLVMKRRKLDVILDNIINEHKKINNSKKLVGENGDFSATEDTDHEDLVDVLLRIKESGELEFPFGNDNIKAVIQDIFTGGTDTTSSVINWAMTELIRHPQIMAKAQAEVREIFKGSKFVKENEVQKLKYLKLVIMETLRLHPPGPLLPRASREERIINGYTIPANVTIQVNAWAMQRDPKYWTNPENFEPERFENQPVDFVDGNFQYLPFGAGLRMCPGMTFGLASVGLPLAQLLYSFNWKLPYGIKPEDLDMTETMGLTSMRKDNLLVIATPCDGY